MGTEGEKPAAQAQTNPDGGNGAPTQEQIQAAMELLEAQGYHPVPDDKFKTLKSSAAKEAEARAIAAQAELDALRAKHAEDAKRLREIDNAGKSAQQLHEEQRIEWQRQMQERDQALEEARQAHAASEERYRQTLVEQRLSMLLRGAIDADLAVLAARHRMPGKLGIDDAGRLTYEDAAGIPYVGADAEGKVDAWWQKQTALRAAPAPAGPPTSVGKPSAPPPEKIPYNPPQGSLDEQIEWAREADRRNAELEGQSR